MKYKLLLTNVFIVVCMTSITGCLNLEQVRALRTLSALDKSERAKEGALKQETLNYEKLNGYIVNNAIEKGMSKDAAAERFGRPIVILEEPDGERWAYKSAHTDWFGEEKIYLFFDKEDRLVKWEK